MTRYLFLLAAVCAFGADEFWKKPPQEWTEEQLETLLKDSPWARSAEGSHRTGLQANPVVTFLASSKPMRLAEEELIRRRVKRPEVARAIRSARAEFNEYLDKNAGHVIALAIACDPNALADAQDARKMEEDTFMKAGKHKVKIMGHFPPSPSDPFLRLLFPRAVDAKAKTIEFEFYLPGGPSPYRLAIYKVSELAGEY